MFHVRDFWFRTHVTNLDDTAHRDEEGGMAEGGLLVWLQVEPSDAEDLDRAVRKSIKNIKWLARKVEVQSITLHSFAHLGGKNATPDEARALLGAISTRLSDVGFEVIETPFGFFNEFRMHVEGPGLAKVFKEF